MILTISDVERRAGIFTGDRLEQAIAAVRRDGYVVIVGAIDPAHIAALRARMDSDMRLALADGGETRVSVAPPREAELLFADVMGNRFAVAVLEGVMGREVVCGAYTSNINGPGAPEQELHIDNAARTADDPGDYPTRCMIVNIPLIDFTAENGATELWPGTHVIPAEIGTRWITAAQQAERGAVERPIRACMPAGSILLRDERLWHRARANATTTIRAMLGFIVNGGFDAARETPDRIPCIGPVPRATAGFFAALPIRYNPRFVDGPVDNRCLDRLGGMT
ncbi:MAG: phytanoyl-CoA dioxygenase family protein [Planctomycetes bacterium]|nr:phytanoyl-CoA dioxygenase family protein [Planctomycetota bacterium]